MRLDNLTIEGFRSIKYLELTKEHLGHGPVVVLYGKNGAGKSNILAAVQTFFKLLGYAIESGEQAPGTGGFGTAGVLDAADVVRGTPGQQMRFAGKVAFVSPLVAGELLVDAVEAELCVSSLTDKRFELKWEPLKLATRLRSGERFHLVTSQAGLARVRSTLGDAGFRAFFAEWRARMMEQSERGLLLVPAVREPSRATDIRSGVVELAVVKATRAALQGDLATALFTAKNTSDLELKGRRDRLRKLLSLSLPDRPTLEATEEPGCPVALVEEHADASPPYTVPISLVGTGLQQVYAILGAILLSKATIAVVEEPEAHLHEPTTGLKLRELLGAVTQPSGDGRPDVEQLFLATHSSLFDLNPDGYVEVALDPVRGTIANWVPGLIGIDSGHLFEPGAARHALVDALRAAGDAETIAYWRPDHTPVRRREMLELLAKGDPIAVDYLKVVTSAAVQLVALRPPQAT